ncbi:hypothetical protein [Exiguobacterium sp. 9-2]|uniref:hypothetical protein n=1 Tax=Exiguobacterium sp. 9-2 TaxID=3112419 RepID=UPI002E373E16|nr:hypothetical protein [Exiguobacterium sp. 9-2]
MNSKTGENLKTIDETLSLSGLFYSNQSSSYDLLIDKLNRYRCGHFIELSHLDSQII